MIPTALTRYKRDGNRQIFNRGIICCNDDSLTIYKNGFVIRWTPLKVLLKRVFGI